MDLPSPLQSALQRLGGALDALEGAAARRAADRPPAGDGARLAAELEAALARGRALEGAAADVSARLDRADAAVRAALDALAAGA